jgi:MFS family permease
MLQRGIGPANAEVSGQLVAMMIAALYLGRLLFAWPIGSISDRVDRRTVLASLAIFTGALMVLMVVPQYFGAGEGRAASGAAGPTMQGVAFLVMLVLGGMIFPMYSVASSLAFDRAQGKSKLDISTTLLVVSSIGSIVGPSTVTLVSKIAGNLALPLCIFLACALVILTGVLRRTTVAAPAEHTSMAPLIPASSVEMAQAAAELVGKQLEEEGPSNLDAP